MDVKGTGIGYFWWGLWIEQEAMFYLNVRKKCITVRLIELWDKLSREIVQSFSLEIFKTWISCATYSRQSALEEKLDLTISRCSFQPLLLCSSANVIKVFLSENQILTAVLRDASFRVKLLICNSVNLLV